jgi:hypothetical protein
MVIQHMSVKNQPGIPCGAITRKLYDQRYSRHRTLILFNFSLTQISCAIGG